MDKLFKLCDRFSRRAKNAKYMWIHAGIPTILPNGELLTVWFSPRNDGYSAQVEINEKHASVGKLCDLPARGAYPLRLRPRALDIDPNTRLPTRVFLEISALPARQSS